MILSLRCLSNTLVPPASTVPLDFTSCYYQSSLLSFTSIVHTDISVRPKPTLLGGWVLLYLRYFWCGPLSYRACVCVLIDVWVQLLLYMFRGQHKIIPQHSQSKSSTKPPSPFLTCQFKMATRPLLFTRHPIPWAIAKYTLLSLTYFDRPNQSTVLSRLL